MIKHGKHLFNDGWQFTLRNIGTVPENINDSLEWYNVEIPHDWLIGDTRHLYETGEGWYRKRFALDSDDLESVLSVIFDGVYMNSSVFVNGKHVGDWKYGYSTFGFDISGYVHEGTNELLVRVCHEAPNTRWYSGAGIYRNVWLRSADKTHLTEDGVYIVQRREENGWSVTVTAETSVPCEVRYSIKEIPEAVFTDGKAFVSEPKLWDTENPALYTLAVEAVSDGKVTDTAEIRFGFRTLDFSPDKGFLLNGVQTKLHGVCMHHDLGALGAAMNKSALKRQLEILKSFGVNAVRTSHNMPARELIELSEEMGLLINSEGFDMWELPKNENDYARFFPEWYKKDVAAWVRRDRNSPCVIMWSIGNEIYDTHKSPRGLEVAKMLKEAVLEHDPCENAVCTIGSNFMSWENAQSVADYLKLAGYNYAETLYDGHHEKHPDWFIYGSETASTVRSRGVYHFPASAKILTHDDLQCSDYGNSVVGWGRDSESAWTMDRDREYCGGQFIWTGFDYIGEPTPYSTKNSYFGIIDTAGFPKDSYYMYKAAWTKEPFIHILPYWDWNEGEEISVFTYSNVSDVELFFNGKSLGKQHINMDKDLVLHGSWKLKYAKGELVARAYSPDGTVAAEERISSFGDPDKIVITPENSVIKADGRDIAFLCISVCDKNGEPVANARSRVNVDVSGCGRLVGLDNGDSTDYDSYKGTNRRLFGGKLLAMVQATLESGDITVTVSSEGLETASVTLTAEKCEIPEGVSVVSEKAYPAYIQPKVSEIPLRKIELTANKTKLDENNKTAEVKAVLLPENASYKDIVWKCVLESGVEIGCAEASGDSGGAVVTAKGDGRFRLRAMCANGGIAPQIISELEFEITGLGETVSSPYSFISASLYTVSDKVLNVVEKGAVSGIQSRTVIGFTNVDFGSYGSDILRLHIGNAGSDPVPVEVWLGNPDENGAKKLYTAEFMPNGRWDGFDPADFTLPERIRGIQTICFVISTKCIFGGFEFVKLNKAFELLSPAENDGLYGDEYTVNGDCIENIGNNVLIEFSDMDFGDGVTKITICGKTPNDNNTIQLRCTAQDGSQTTQLLEFAYSDTYTEREFTLEKISGTTDISFVFLPGSKFDFKSFKFE